MFVVRKESGWNMVSNAMKYVTALTYRWVYIREENHGTYEVIFIKRRLADER